MCVFDEGMCFRKQCNVYVNHGTLKKESNVFNLIMSPVNGLSWIHFYVVAFVLTPLERVTVDHGVKVSAGSSLSYAQI